MYFFHLSMFSDFSDPKLWLQYLVVQLPNSKEAQACLETPCSASNKISSNLLRLGDLGCLVAIKLLPLKDHSQLGSTNNKMRLSRLNPFSETLLANKISNQLWEGHSASLPLLVSRLRSVSRLDCLGRHWVPSMLPPTLKEHRVHLLHRYHNPLVPTCPSLPCCLLVLGSSIWNLNRRKNLDFSSISRPVPLFPAFN